MTVCTYDDQTVAEEHLARLKSAGVPALLAPCLLHDPDQPDAELLDLVVARPYVARAQQLLDIVPPTEPDQADEIRRFEEQVSRTTPFQKWVAWCCLGLTALVVLVLLLDALRP